MAEIINVDADEQENYTAERKPFMKSAISTIETMIELFHFFFKCLQDFTRSTNDSIFNRLYPLLLTISTGPRGKGNR